VRRYANLQLDLVTSVLDFERLAAGGVTCRAESFELGPLVADVLALQAGRERPGVQLQAHVAHDCPTLETDRIKVHQVLRNLVDNAVKFTESGRVVVEAAPGPRDGWLTIAVTDTGPGVRRPTCRTSSSRSTSSARAARAARAASASASASCSES
jgi:signal transduction histidine kinase